ncbi:unnamed protein product [Meloidogyne enterolobii]|uniref:Uncharacterized protein n=1 Tax=Meloidogyne enterolobii TaxID=390850 RepID=A0ACB0YGN4_MELEN
MELLHLLTQLLRQYFHFHVPKALYNFPAYLEKVLQRHYLLTHLLPQHFPLLQVQKVFHPVLAYLLMAL